VVSDGRGSREERRIQMDSVVHFIDVDDAFKRLKKIYKTHTLADEQKQALDAFKKSYEEYKERQAEKDNE
jgi:hypothetical protein